VKTRNPGLKGTQRREPKIKGMQPGQNKGGGKRGRKKY
jgi:hypothetical protein